MANFVKFTNASLFHDGNPIYINMDHITSIYENNLVDSSEKKAETILYSSISNSTWEIKENIDKVMEELENEQKFQHRRSKKLY